MEFAFLGIDPGQSGGLALLTAAGTLDLYKMPETIADTKDLFELLAPITTFAMIERAQAMPKQGVASTFKFGYNFGILVGMLAAFAIPHEFVSARIWQKELNCLSRGDKNVTKAKAQRLFPSHKITHATADAALIAVFCRIRSKESVIWDSL